MAAPGGVGGGAMIATRSTAGGRTYNPPSPAPPGKESPSRARPDPPPPAPLAPAGRLDPPRRPVGIRPRPGRPLAAAARGGLGPDHPRPVRPGDGGQRRRRRRLLPGLLVSPPDPGPRPRAGRAAAASRRG